MYKNVEELEKEIDYLKRRISTLEKKENRRKSFKYLKIIIKILIIGTIVFGIWRAYDYVVNGIPNMISEKIHEVLPFLK